MTTTQWNNITWFICQQWINYRITKEDNTKQSNQLFRYGIVCVIMYISILGICRINRTVEAKRVIFNCLYLSQFSCSLIQFIVSPGDNRIHSQMSIFSFLFLWSTERQYNVLFFHTSQKSLPLCFYYCCSNNMWLLMWFFLCMRPHSSCVATWQLISWLAAS